MRVEWFIGLYVVYNKYPTTDQRKKTSEMAIRLDWDYSFDLVKRLFEEIGGFFHLDPKRLLLFRIERR